MPDADGHVSTDELRTIALEFQSYANLLARKANNFGEWVNIHPEYAEIRELRYELKRAIELKDGAEAQAGRFLQQRQVAMQDTALLSGLLREVLKEVEASQRSERNVHPSREISQELVDRIRKAV